MEPKLVPNLQDLFLPLAEMEDDAFTLSDAHIEDLLKVKCRTAGLHYGFWVEGTWSPKELAVLERTLDEETQGELWLEVLKLQDDSGPSRILVGASLTVDREQPTVQDFADLDQAEDCVENHRDLFGLDIEPQWFAFLGPDVQQLSVQAVKDAEERGAPALEHARDENAALPFERQALENAVAEAFKAHEAIRFWIRGVFASASPSTAP